MVGWDLIPGVVDRWESGRNVPPADVLLAAEALAAEALSARGRRLELVR
jgi:hypothetical protein